jgi:hypothetical protein
MSIFDLMIIIIPVRKKQKKCQKIKLALTSVTNLRMMII